MTLFPLSLEFLHYCAAHHNRPPPSVPEFFNAPRKHIQEISHNDRYNC